MLTFLMIAVYATIALFAAAMTYSEQCEKNQKSMMFKTLGFLACAVWPLTVVAVVIAAQMPSFEVSNRVAVALKDV